MEKMSVNANVAAQGGWLDHSRHWLYSALIVAVVIAGSIWALSIDTRYLYLLVYVWFGVVYGLFLQYGRFCMAAAVRDLFAVKVPRMAVGMMIAVGLYALVASAVTLAGFNTFHAHPMGWHVVIGGLIFGFGFVFTGGCASGSLYKAGEGNMNSVLVILAISFSQAYVVIAGGWLDSLTPEAWTAAALAKDMPEELSVTKGWFDLFTAGYIWDLKGATLAEMLGFEEGLFATLFINTFVNALLPVILLLVALYVYFYRKSYLRKTGNANPSLGEDLAGIWHMCISSKNTAIAGIGLGIFAGLHMWATGALREHYEIFNFGELLVAMGHTDGLSIQETVFDPGYWYTTHEITGTALNSFKLLNPEECGDCHKNKLKTYRDTYHGKINKLGYAYTAKCYNCHGSHDILSPEDPDSKVHPDNKLKTCKQCHNGRGLPEAPDGFVSYYPHADASDYGRYSQIWITSRFMGGLLVVVFAFFWLHSGLWYYREWKERKTGTPRPHIRVDGVADIDDHKHFRRFPIGWRIAHLIFALATMMLVLTGTTVLFADSAWAPVVARLAGGPEVLGFWHRVAVVFFLGIFFIHLLYILQHLLRKKDFRWFGPDSLLPNWKDLDDCVAMFKWFFGRGPKPMFERWTYFEKFDYWAVFWGVTVIGSSGFILAFPHISGQFLPGWIFNVASLVHSEEAFLAAVFLFTVHFFNNHFRPDKLPPPDIVMFTGTQSIEEFRREHPAQYRRMLESGEIHKYLVDEPSRPFTIGSKILGLVLITMGLTLLILVGTGFLGGSSY